MKKDIGYSQEGGQELPTMTPLLVRACVRAHTRTLQEKNVLV